MLSSIHPLGERGRGNRYPTTVAAFIIGGVVGGGAVGLGVGLIGWLTGWALAGAFTPGVGVLSRPEFLSRAGFAGLVLLGVAVWWAEASGKRLPSARRQVNEDWIGRYRGWVYGLGFGAQLGAGIATYITAGEVLIWLAAMALLAAGAESFGAGVAAAAGLGAVFGLVRGASILAAVGIRTPEQLVGFHRRLARVGVYRRRLGLAGLVCLTVVAAAGLVADVQLVAWGGR